MPVREIAIPASARALSTLPRVDYTDAFVMEAEKALDRTAEQWARAMMDNAPAATRSALRRGWFALGLKIAPGSSDRYVLGWEVRQRTPDQLLLGADSRIGMPAELLFELRDGDVLFATLVQHKNPLVRAVWAAVAPQHRRIVTQLLRRSVR
jgi:Protein of unknown function (DUF2867)